MVDNDFLKEALKSLKLDLTQSQYEQFDKYFELLIEKNKVMNLTTITEYKDVVIKHFVDSLSITRIANFESDLNIIDVGTGAGFPGIPLKIVYPQINVVLLDSLNKRINFLDNVIDELDLNSNGSIKTIHGRAEDYGQDNIYREEFDLCLSRAVGNLSILSEYCLPFVKEKGSFISYKSGNVDDEILQAKKAITILGGEISKIDDFQLPFTDMNRKLVKIDKIKKTPKKYPRDPGTPKKNPIN